jgi:hypothetical protein
MDTRRLSKDLGAVRYAQIIDFQELSALCGFAEVPDVQQAHVRHCHIVEHGDGEMIRPHRIV